MIRISKGFNKFEYYIFLFTILQKVVFKDFPYFLGTDNFRKISLLDRTISIACTIPCQRLFFAKIIFIGVVLGRVLEENRWSESFYKTEEVIMKDSLLSKIA